MVVICVELQNCVNLKSLYNSTTYDHWELCAYAYILSDNFSLSYVFPETLIYFDINLWPFPPKKNINIWLSMPYLLCVHDMEILASFWLLIVCSKYWYLYYIRNHLLLPGFVTFTAACTSAEVDRCSKTYCKGTSSSCQLGMCYMLSL